MDKGQFEQEKYTDINEDVTEYTDDKSITWIQKILRHAWREVSKQVSGS